MRAALSSVRLPRKIQVTASGPQAYGAAASYAEKFLWRGILKIPTGDADVDDMDQRGLPDRRDAARSSARSQRRNQPSVFRGEIGSARETCCRN